MHHIALRHGFNSLFLKPDAPSHAKSTGPLRVRRVARPASARSNATALGAAPSRPAWLLALRLRHRVWARRAVFAEAFVPRVRADLPRPPVAATARGSGPKDRRLRPIVHRSTWVPLLPRRI